MYNQKRSNTVHFHLKNLSNQFHNSQTNNYREEYTNQSPVYFSQYNYEEEEPIPYMHQIHYIKKGRKPIDCYEYIEKYDNSQRYDNPKVSYFLSNYNSMKNSSEEDKSFIKRGVNSLTNQNPKRINERNNYNNKTSNGSRSLVNSHEKKNYRLF